MKIQQYPNPKCRGFTLDGEDVVVSTEVVVYLDSISITQYWQGGDESYVAIEGESFCEFMSGIKQCLNLLSETQQKDTE